MYDRDQYAAHLALQAKADNTIRAYVALYQRWIDWCATNAADPTAFHALDVRAWAKTVHGSRSMLDQAAAAINHACAMYGLEPSGASIPRPRKPKLPPDNLDPDVALRLLAHAPTEGDAGTAVLVGLYTGARRSEIAGMECEKLGPEICRWWRPKTRDWHEVPTHEELWAHLEPRLVGQWLFGGRWGGHVAPGTVSEWISKVGHASGVGHVRPKQLRATAITWIYEETGDVRAAQLFAGHTDINTTTVYTGESQRRLRAAVASLYRRDPSGEVDGQAA